ncbi:MAG: FMN-binding negative transcriptional regulator [Burkholderiaceae bacterium]|nr:FMN-binding negative transcriptional regulator [Burkholderiaceae bacterium]
MTYLPSHFKETDPATLHALVRDYPLATWVVAHRGELLVNHIPFLLDASRGEHGTLVGHVARANPVWQALQAAPVSGVAVFTGPQAYISPNWYPSKHAHGKEVPTYNYVAVHAHGVAQVVQEADRLLDIVTRLTQRHEAGQALPWSVGDAPADYIAKMLGAIVGIEISVQRWVGKYKASQNKQAPEQRGVVAGLVAHGGAPEARMAQLIASKLST